MPETDYKTLYSNDKNINTLNRGSYNDFGDGTPAKQIIGDSDQLLEAIIVNDPKLTVKEITTAGTKQSHSFRDGTKRFNVTSGEKLTAFYYNWNETDFDAGIFHSVDEGGDYEIIGTGLTAKTLYFKTEKNNVEIEIEEWL
jgi:hypothetical protein